MDVPNDGLHLNGGFLVLLLREQASDLALGHPLIIVYKEKGGREGGGISTTDGPFLSLSSTPSLPLYVLDGRRLLVGGNLDALYGHL